MDKIEAAELDRLREAVQWFFYLPISEQVALSTKLDKAPQEFVEALLAAHEATKEGGA